MRLILWFVILICVLFSLTYVNTEPLEPCNLSGGGPKIFRIKHGNPYMDSSRGIIKCNYTQYSPTTNLKECIYSANKNISTSLMAWDNTSTPPDNSLKTKYYMVDSDVLGDVDACKWMLFRDKTGFVDPYDDTLMVDDPVDTVT